MRLSSNRLAGDADDIRSICAKSDAELDAKDYAALFQVGGPAGDYEEIVYYLPLAISWLHLHPTDACVFGRGVYWFVDNNASALENDGLLYSVYASLTSCVDRWTQVFSVVHYGQEFMRSHGFVKPYWDCVENADVVGDSMDAFCTFSSLVCLAHYFFSRRLLFTASCSETAWALEIARQSISSERDKIAIDELVARPLLPLVDAISCCEEMGAVPHSYWRDLRLTLSLPVSKSLFEE